MEAAVVPVPDHLLGQAIKAFIVTSPHGRLSEKQVKRYCQRNLEPFMVPKQIVFQDSLPKSPSGKIAKRLLN
jgi:acyl-coenzyme A synthetase/AMP-(fatty) acid ligase